MACCRASGSGSHIPGFGRFLGVATGKVECAGGADPLVSAGEHRPAQRAIGQPRAGSSSWRSRPDGYDLARDDLKPLLPVPDRSLASTLTHPARRNDSASASGISTVPSAAMFSKSILRWPMPAGARRRIRRSLSACCRCASSARIRQSSKIPALELGPLPCLNQSSSCAVESTWSSCLPCGKTLSSTMHPSWILLSGL